MRLTLSFLLLALSAFCAMAVELPVVPIAAVESPDPVVAPKALAADPKPNAMTAPALTAPAAKTGTKEAELRVTPGVNEIVDVAIGHLNRIVTPFDSPKVITASPAETRVEDNVVYVGTDKPSPIGLFITDLGTPGSEAISLTLVPKRIPPRELRLTLSGASGGDARARRWEESQPYVDALRNLFRAIALGERPSGYDFKDHPPKWTPPCAPPAAASYLTYAFTNGQSLFGHHLEVAIGTARNTGDRAIELDETWCAGSGIAAVAYWPRNLLEPGQVTEVYVAKRKTSPARAPERRSLVEVRRR